MRYRPYRLTRPIGGWGNEQRGEITHDSWCSHLGGRLPLYDREGLTPVQKDLFDWQMREAVPWAGAAGFHARTQAGQLIGPFNPAILSPRRSRRRSSNLCSQSTKARLSVNATGRSSF
jgi:hypothetical protein